MGQPHAVLLHWRLKPGRYDDFARAWEVVTRAMLAENSLGSALFEGEDGTVYALARWPDQAAREKAFATEDVIAARAAMAEAVEEVLPSLHLSERINLWTLPI
jgi:quinol monooxygenase YgiN